MSAYFYTLNDNGELQIDDSTVLQMVSKTNTVSANVTAGKLYCYQLDSNTLSAAFSIDSGTLYISPQGINSNGTRWYLVGANNNNTITCKQIIINTNLSPASSPFAGMEIYNASGKVIYSTKYECMSMETFCNRPYKFSNFTNGPGTMEFESMYDDGYYACPGNIQPGLLVGWYYDHGVVDNCFYKPLGQHGVDAWSYTARTKPYIQALMSPWFPSVMQTSDNKQYVYMCGYKISGNTVSLETTMQKYKITSYNGLSPDFNWDAYTGDGGVHTNGVCATSYMFNVLTRF